MFWIAIGRICTSILSDRSNIRFLTSARVKGRTDESNNSPLTDLQLLTRQARETKTEETER